MRRIVLCADDYALSPGISGGIRELISAGRINATSVMTIFPEFEQEAKTLLTTKSPIPLQIGLHATLTGNFTPLKATPIATTDGCLPKQQQTWPPFGYFRIDPVAVKTEVKAQLEKFISAFGRARLCRRPPACSIDAGHPCAISGNCQGVRTERLGTAMWSCSIAL